MEDTNTSRRLVNVYVCNVQTDYYPGHPNHRTYPFKVAGAWGTPEDALPYARQIGADGLWIVDVSTNEAWYTPTH